jgi:PHD/YefM family antitoxin component YafN of YafNO toxin-antitoxin module
MKQKPLIPEYEVKTTSETRQDLTKILADFRVKGKKAVPIIFGSHRKPEAVLVPAGIWKKILNEIDDLQLALTVQDRLSSPQNFEEVTFEQLRSEIDAMNAADEKLNDAKGSKVQGV